MQAERALATDVVVRREADGEDGAGHDEGGRERVPSREALAEEERREDGVGDERQRPERGDDRLGGQAQCDEVGDAGDDGQQEPGDPVRACVVRPRRRRDVARALVRQLLRRDAQVAQDGRARAQEHADRPRPHRRRLILVRTADASLRFTFLMWAAPLRTPRRYEVHEFS